MERQNNRGIKNFIGYFFGALKQGGYNSVTSGFKSSEEIGEEETIARLEKRKKEREEKKQKLEELLFGEWLETKTKEELNTISHPVGEPMGQFHLAALKSHFLEKEMVEFQKGLNNA